jgi:hypothetical protein
MPEPEREESVCLADLFNERPMTREAWQLFSCYGEEVTAEIEVEIPKEATLSQLVHNCVLPFMNHKMDARTTFRWDLP